MRLFATTPFSMEKPVCRELMRLHLGYTDIREGRVYFESDGKGLARACVNLRGADRIFWELASFDARSFDELFAQIVKIEWANIISQRGKIHVSAKCARSKLMSVPDVQRISKIAIIKAMRRRFPIDNFAENGEEYPVEIHISRDRVTVALDCCGESLHKRGYRVKTAPAPLRETFAAGLLNLIGYKGTRPFVDPFCGSGTLPIEAAMIALNIAPGMKRNFACERFCGFESVYFEEARREAKKAVLDVPVKIFVSDISKEMEELTRFHAARAGVESYITLRTCAAAECMVPASSGMLLTNPPYGQRLGKQKEMEQVSEQIRLLLLHFSGWDRAVLSGDKGFEQNVRRADKIRRFYNGNIECNLYSYFAQNQ